MSELAGIKRKDEGSAGFCSDDLAMTSQKALNILIIDSNVIYREGLKACLMADSKNWVVSVSANNDLDALFRNELVVDLIMLSVEKDIDLLEMTKMLASLSSKPVIIVMCNNNADIHKAGGLIGDGVKGLIEYNSDIGIYKDAINGVVSGKNYYTSTISTILFTGSAEEDDGGKKYNLTKREVDVLMLISSGLSNKEIANHYTLSVRTVETHRQNIRHKTQVNSLKDLIQISKDLDVGG